ncbi:MAG: hypothetical protein ABW318_16130 [Vicinamibacterales bacterium]
MSFLEAVRIRTLHLPRVRASGVTWVNPLEAIAKAVQSYAEAAAVPYLLTFGFDRHESMSKTRNRQAVDD